MPGPAEFLSSLFAPPTGSHLQGPSPDWLRHTTLQSRQAAILARIRFEASAGRGSRFLSVLKMAPSDGFAQLRNRFPDLPSDHFGVAELIRQSKAEATTRSSTRASVQAFGRYVSELVHDISALDERSVQIPRMVRSFLDQRRNRFFGPNDAKQAEIALATYEAQLRPFVMDQPHEPLPGIYASVREPALGLANAYADGEGQRVWWALDLVPESIPAVVCAIFEEAQQSAFRAPLRALLRSPRAPEAEILNAWDQGNSVSLASTPAAANVVEGILSAVYARHAEAFKPRPNPPYFTRPVEHEGLIQYGIVRLFRPPLWAAQRKIGVRRFLGICLEQGLKQTIAMRIDPRDGAFGVRLYENALPWLNGKVMLGSFQ